MKRTCFRFFELVVLAILCSVSVCFADGPVTPKIAAGIYHTVFVKTDGSLWTWGDNQFGQLGDGTTADKVLPVPIGAETDWMSVAAGGFHTVALKADGSLWAWGNNGSGQLGDGTTVSKSSPVQIDIDTDWVTVAAGRGHTVALKADGTLWAWGYNNYGQLGDGTTVNKSSPVKIGMDSDWVTVAAGDDHTLALKADGTLWAWGYNNIGQLGDGTSTNRLFPVQIGSDNNWRTVEAGDYHTVALKTDGTLWAWGYNADGELGNGAKVNKSSPVKIGTDNNWMSVVAGAYHTVALKSTGTLYAWGSNAFGQLGDGTQTKRLSPTKIGIDTNWVTVAAGEGHSVALKSDGTVWNWGMNADGQLGDSTRTYRSSPVQPGPDTTITGKPASSANSSTATFSFNSSTANTTFLCQIDGGIYSECFSPLTYNSLAEGAHTFSVKATDLWGTMDPTPATYTWTVDTVAPETTIGSKPANPSSASSATFSFSSTETNSTFQCSFNSGAYTACSTPKLYTKLASGVHTFSVKATDKVGNTDATPATYIWTISDTVAPDTTITSKPANPSNSPTATFSFGATESDSTFQCSIDSGTFVACSSPKSYNLASGNHTFSVKATDLSGNADATPATYNWKINDTVAPDTTISSKPAVVTNAVSATFSFSSTEGDSTFQCSIDGGAYAACSNPKSYTNLAVGNHTFSVKATDLSGNVDATPAIYTWTVSDDFVAPDTMITSAPANPANSTSATFSFSATETNSTFQCSMDGGIYAACTSPKTYTLAAGNHSFAVKAIDIAGNVDATPATYAWTIDLVAPDTAMTSKPANPANSTSATFSFSATETNSTFQCSMDSGTYAVCTSPMTYSLAEGSHTISVKATDQAGNTDATPTTYTWIIDTVPPDTTISSKPANPSNSTAATFSFNATEGNSTFECSIDNGAYAACNSPMTYTLAAGNHTFSVKARDKAGNMDATPAAYTWTIDLVAPNTTIIGKPAIITNHTSDSFFFTSTESNSSFECSIDNGAYAACSNPKPYSNLAEGTHTFAVKATDMAGNTDATPSTAIWTIELVAPDTTIVSRPANPSNSTSASFCYWSSENYSRFVCSLDNSAYVPCYCSQEAYSGLAEGAHTFSVKAIDEAGNMDPTPATYEWTIDTADRVAPDTTITLAPGNPTSATSVTFNFTATENNSTFQCSLDSGAYEACSSPMAYAGLSLGSHAFSVKATDQAGNTDATPATFSWTIIDVTAPNTSITSMPGNPTNAASVTFNFTATENNSTFQCSLDSGAYEACSSPMAYAGLVVGNHTFSVKATDPAGNTDTTPDSYTWIIETDAPETTITSMPTNPISVTAATFSFTATESPSTFECSLDGGAYEACSSPIVYSGLTQGSHTFSVKAKDLAGNTDTTPDSYAWAIIDAVALETTIISMPTNLANSTSATFNFAATKSNSTFECSLDNSIYEACSSPKEYSGLALGSHTFSVKATDQEGNPDTTPASYAWRIILPFKKIDTSAQHTVFLKSNGTLYAWGSNNYGQLGNGTTTNRLAPAQTGTDTDWVSVAASSVSTVALKANGTLWAWGNNTSGQLGDGTTTRRLLPVKIGTNTDWVSVAVGNSHTIALKADGTLWAWGLNSAGQLGDGTSINKFSPIQIGTDTDWVSVNAGANQSIALKSNGSLWAWGDNSGGQLGDGTYVNKAVPLQIGTDTDWVSVDLGNLHTVALKGDGTLWAWGYNGYGQLGDGTTKLRPTPVMVGGNTSWMSVAGGFNHTVALKADGTLWASGDNLYGQLGDGTNLNVKSSRVQIGTDTNWFSVVARMNHTVALKADGTLWAWGYNAFGQLGDGSIVDKKIPVPILY